MPWGGPKASKGAHDATEELRGCAIDDLAGVVRQPQFSLSSDTGSWAYSS